MNRQKMDLPHWILDEAKQLSARYRSNRAPQALMIHGAKGMGKSLLANQLANNILCLDHSKQMACGRCQSCHWFNSQNHPDWIVMDGEESILVDQIRELTKFSQLSPETNCKIINIINADRMNLNASNSLLKLLEEPPKDLFFILTTANLDRLPITIVSRVQKYFMRPISKSEVVNWLASYLGQSEEITQKLLAYSYGAPIQAVWLYNNNFLTELEEITRLVETCNRKEKLTKSVADLLKKEQLTFICLFYWLLAIQRQEITLVPMEISCFLLNFSADKVHKQYYKLLEIKTKSIGSSRIDLLLESWFNGF